MKQLAFLATHSIVFLFENMVMVGKELHVSYQTLGMTSGNVDRRSDNAYLYVLDLVRGYYILRYINPLHKGTTFISILYFCA
jgi:hypothetical protein